MGESFSNWYDDYWLKAYCRCEKVAHPDGWAEILSIPGLDRVVGDI
tara:strand:+ start:3850 stop:3987 length:138 start_codon:yes stop_codon:yes gene_type:complete